jgi:serine phosphatase RsbU (regulator of sigma subunit)/anti-sigma regulatory factor (Ser/Thr protein kinase)
LKNRYSSLAVLPLSIGTGVSGVVVLLFSDKQQFSDTQRIQLLSFAALCSNALERARRAELEHEIAITLQSSLLPSVPKQIGHVQLAGRYLPGSRYAVVGGDWYDVIRLRDERILFVVGDVVGHGMRSAAAMGKLSTATRALALVTPEPVDMLTNLDAIAVGDEAMRFASMALVLVDLRTGVLKISLAGHPAPLLRWPSGEVLELDRARSVSVGGMPVKRRQQELHFQGTISLVLYTDGLTERRDQHATERLKLLISAFSSGIQSPTVLSDHILAKMADDEQRDDVALLCVRMTSGPPDFQQTIPSTLNSLSPLRSDFREWTQQAGLTDSDGEDALLAVGEAATNAIEHGNKSIPSLHVVVHAEIRNDQLRVAVSDQGQWSTPSSPTNGTRGRGLNLIRALSDTVSVDTTPGGTVLTFVTSLHESPRALPIESSPSKVST